MKTKRVPMIIIFSNKYIDIKILIKRFQSISRNYLISKTKEQVRVGSPYLCPNKANR